MPEMTEKEVIEYIDNHYLKLGINPFHPIDHKEKHDQFNKLLIKEHPCLK